MQNKELAQAFQLINKLLDLYGENQFKSKSYSNAAFRIGRMELQLKDVPYDEIDKVDGIGKSIAAKVVELLETGEIEYLNELVSKTPPGVLDMLSIKGVGPKKIGVIWRELGIESMGELLYACNENRLVDLKGFGSKTQEQIKKIIEYKISNQGLFHYAAVEQIAEGYLISVSELPGIEQAALTGAIRRKNQLIAAVEILAAVESGRHAEVVASLGNDGFELEDERLVKSTDAGLRLEIILCEEHEFVGQHFLTTATEAHLEYLNLDNIDEATSEEEVYEASELPYIVPEMREGLQEFEWAKNHSDEELVENEHLKGILHNHSTWSDGRHSLEEMATHCRDLGYEYLGICDHSKSAFYANGLQVERVAQQQREIDALNQQLAPFVIYKGIESDILNNGSLDYETEVLESFDFIVASVHSNLKMPEEKATQRLLTAIENPFTTILGHPTGRLLLSREGYPIDHKKVIRACAANNVVIELNANPFRLDLDWRWIHFAMEQGVKIAINPDAHNKEGYQHMHFGVCVARKGGLTTDMTFNALSREEIGLYFTERKSNIGASLRS